ncbi:putative F-box protein [Iris pallida]|uniref:F-box protein n=1 Tax=Iris pallida TaxID=29817 RepID=A0AAX6EIG9_IRIPA|nr:putative F-box protein [Iris pallida]
MMTMVSWLMKMIGIHKKGEGEGEEGNEEEVEERARAQLLPSDMVRFIAGQVTIPERVRLGAVCTSWSSALKEGGENGELLRFPPMPAIFLYELNLGWMLALSVLRLARRLSKKNLFISHRLRSVRRTLSLYNHPEKRRYHLSLPPDTLDCYGCCDGWLVLEDVKPRKLSLFNPATQAQIYLPTLTTTTKYYIQKVVLSASPTADPDGFVAVAVYNVYHPDQTFGRVAFYRPGDEEWAPICSLPFSLWKSLLMDLAYHDNTFFLLSRYHGLFTFDLTGPSPVVFEYEDSTVNDINGAVDNIFLVSSRASGDLLCVKGEMFNTTLEQYKSFAIKRFDPEAAEGSSCWVEIKELGDQSLFLGSVNSMSLPSSMDAATKGNCIYFMEKQFMGENKFMKWLLGIRRDYRMRSYRFVKAYDVEQGIINTFFEFEENNAMAFKGMWFLPSLL